LISVPFYFENLKKVTFGRVMTDDVDDDNNERYEHVSLFLATSFDGVGSGNG
jgi:hypothetical protein